MHKFKVFKVGDLVSTHDKPDSIDDRYLVNKERTPTSAFVVSRTPCRLVGIDQEALWKLFGKTRQVANNLLTLLSQRIRNSNSNKIIEDLRRQLYQAHKA